MSAPDFISDDQMNALEASGATPDTSAMPDFIPNDQMDSLMRPKPPAAVDNRPSWRDATYQVAKDLGEGAFAAVPATLGFVNDLGQSAMRAVTHATGLAENPNEKIFRLDTTRKFAGEASGVFDKLAGVRPEDNTVEGPVEDYSRAVLQSVALPGAPISNAIMGVGAETAHKIAPESDIAPIVGALVTHKAMGAGRSAAIGAADTVENVANAMDRKSLGTRASDYGTKSSVRTIETPEGDVSTLMKETLDKLVEENDLGTSRDPSKLLKAIGEKEAPIQSDINQKIKDYDVGVQNGTNAPAVVKLDSARAMLDSGEVPADLAETYRARLDKLEAGINNRSFGRLSYLQKQKVALGKSYDPADQVLSGFNRAIYSDLKNTIESYVPEVGDLNKQLQPYKMVRPIVERSLTASENASPLSKLRDLSFTTGGIGAGGIAGAAAGGPLGMVIGLGASGTLRALATPTGQALLARGLRGGAGLVKTALGASEAPVSVPAQAVRRAPPSAPAGPAYGPPNIMPSSAPTGGSMPGTAQAVPAYGPPAISAVFSPRGAVTAPEAIAPQSPATPSFGPPMIRELFGMNKQAEAAALSEIKADPYLRAVAKTESGFNPTAKNPKSSATGIFQFIDDTAKRLGVADRTSIADSLGGMKKLTEQNMKRFGDDPYTLYAAHYLGAGLLSKALRGVELTAKEAALVKSFETKALPRFKAAYAESITAVEPVPA